MEVGKKVVELKSNIDGQFETLETNLMEVQLQQGKVDKIIEEIQKIERGELIIKPDPLKNEE